MFKRIYEHLKNRGFDVYTPGQHKGRCAAPYVVINGGGESSYLTGLALERWEFWVYYPLSQFSGLGGYMDDLRAALNDLSPLRNAGEQSSVALDGKAEAYVMSVVYNIIKRRSV